MCGHDDSLPDGCVQWRAFCRTICGSAERNRAVQCGIDLIGTRLAHGHSDRKSTRKVREVVHCHAIDQCREHIRDWIAGELQRQRRIEYTIEASVR